MGCTRGKGAAALLACILQALCFLTTARRLVEPEAGASQGLSSAIVRIGEWRRRALLDSPEFPPFPDLDGVAPRSPLPPVPPEPPGLQGPLAPGEPSPADPVGAGDAADDEPPPPPGEDRDTTDAIDPDVEPGSGSDLEPSPGVDCVDGGGDESVCAPEAPPAAPLEPIDGEVTSTASRGSPEATSAPDGAVSGSKRGGADASGADAPIDDSGDDGTPIGPIIGGAAAAIVVAALVAGCVYWRCCKASRSTPVGATHGTLVTDPGRSSGADLYPSGGAYSPDPQKQIGVYSSAPSGGAAPAHHMVAPMGAPPSATPPNGSQGGHSGSLYMPPHASSAYPILTAPHEAQGYASHAVAPSAPASYAAPRHMTGPVAQQAWSQPSQTAAMSGPFQPPHATASERSAPLTGPLHVPPPRRPTHEELAVASTLDDIETALEDVLSASRKLWFADSYHLLPQRVRGDSTVLQRCYDPKDETPLVAKFFPNRDAYDEYSALHGASAVSAAMPARHRTFTNEESIYRSPSGFIFPPFVIVEHGISLDEWREAERPASEATSMFFDLASHILSLHNQRKVYRDFSPRNIMFMEASGSWRLLRVERCATQGSRISPRGYDMRYAAPEVLHALQQNQHTVADPAHDIWTLGVLAYEVLTGQRVFSEHDPEAIFKHANAITVYPWSRPTLHPSFEASGTRELIEGCLRRDPKSRLDAQKIVNKLHKLGNMQTIKDPAAYAGDAT